MVESGLPTPINCIDAGVQNTIEVNAVAVYAVGVHVDEEVNAVGVGVDEDVNADCEVDVVYLEETWVSGVGAEPVDGVNGMKWMPVQMVQKHFCFVMKCNGAL